VRGTEGLLVKVFGRGLCSDYYNEALFGRGAGNKEKT